MDDIHDPNYVLPQRNIDLSLVDFELLVQEIFNRVDSLVLLWLTKEDDGSRDNKMCYWRYSKVNKYTVLGMAEQFVDSLKAHIRRGVRWGS